MLRLISKLRENLKAFIEQRDRMLLVVRCRDEDTPIVLMILDELDQNSEADLYLLSAIPFVTAETYVDQLVLETAERHELVSAALQEEGKPPLPAPPAGLRDRGKTPQERLRELLEYSRSLLPKEARRLVMALAPTEIVDRQAYLHLMTAITPQQKLERWMPRVRVIIRDVVEPPLVPHALVATSPKRSAVLDVDLSNEAMAKDMEQSTEDESLPMEARAQALLSLALIDVAAARAELANQRLLYLMSYYQMTKNLVMQGMVLNAMGDLYNRLEQPARAKDWYETAVVPVAECNNPILLSTLVRNLGDTNYALGAYTEARAYYVELDRISTHLVDAESKSTALHSQGRCDRALGKSADAIQSFEAGAKLCRGTDQHQGLRQHLQQLHEIYSSEGMSGKAQLVAEELNSGGAGARPS